MVTVGKCAKSSSSTGQQKLNQHHHSSNASSPSTMAEFNSLKIVRIQPNSSVFHLYLNRPSRRNALSLEFFSEFPKALSLLDSNPDVAVIVLTGQGNAFCSGIDLDALGSISKKLKSVERGRAGEQFRRDIKHMQAAITAVEQCRKPVIASVHGACIGGAIDIVSACDIRYCSEDAFFSVKEVDLAITADLGTLQRLPAIVGYGNAMELALTGRRFSALEAKQLGLVSRVFPSKESLDSAVSQIAQDIAAKSPLAVTGTKQVLLKSRDLTVEQALDYVATWNSSMLLSDDLKEATSAFTQKRKPVFSKL